MRKLIVLTFVSLSPESRRVPINPPPIRGLGSSAGFDFELEDLGGVGVQFSQRC